MAAQVPSSAPASSPTRATSSWAHAVGVLADGVGHLVGHRGVDLVADAGEHRHGARRDRPGHRLVVEGGQVGAGPAAPHQGEHVERVGGQHADAPMAIDRGASKPCTRESTRSTWNAKPLRRSSSRKSASAAEPSLVTSPTRSGASGIACAALARSSPSAWSRASSSARASSSWPSV